MTERTTFPIINDPEIRSVPWALMAPHGAAALVNHSQTLAQLAARGGVSPAEAVAIIEDRRYMVMPIHVARDRLREYARQHGPVYLQQFGRGLRAVPSEPAVIKDWALDGRSSRSPDLLDALKGLIPIAEYEEMTDEELREEHRQGNGAAQPILNARAAIAKAGSPHSPELTEAIELAKAVRDNPGAPARYRLNKLIAILERL